MELMCRCTMYCCIKFDEIRKKPGASDDLFGGGGEDEENPEGAPPGEEKPKGQETKVGGEFHAMLPQIEPEEINNNNANDNEDKLHLIEEGAGAKVVGSNRDTRNARNQRFNPGTNGATESPSMEM